MGPIATTQVSWKVEVNSQDDKLVAFVLAAKVDDGVGFSGSERFCFEHIKSSSCVGIPSDDH